PALPAHVPEARSYSEWRRDRIRRSGAIPAIQPCRAPRPTPRVPPDLRAARRSRPPAATAAALRSRSIEDFEQPGCAHAASDAHGHHRALGLAAAAFHQRVAHETRAGHAEWVADRDRAAIDVVFFRIDAELVAAIQALRGEGFVELPE